MASAVQILSVVAYLNEGVTTAATIAGSLRTNPVVVRRLLKDMEHAGLVAIRPGKDGGVQLCCDPAAITLDRIWRAVEADTGIFALRQDGNPKCRVNAAMKPLLGPIFRAANDAVQTTLRQTTLADLVGAIPARKA